MTVTAFNVHDVLPLAKSLAELDVTELKLHHLRPVGNAAAHPELLIDDPQLYEDLREQLAAINGPLAIVVDEELLPDSEPRHARYQGSAPRIEADPRGGLTFSCNAVGTDAHAISYDKRRGCLASSGGAGNEVLLEIPPVVYARV
jgi:MoaA/NifB/PqqE/SkfB family radical SAM enzyme